MSKPAKLSVVSSIEFKIEKGVPMRSAGGATAKYPFPEMEVGDSFFVPGDPARVQSNVAGCGRAFAKRYAPDRKFATRLVDGGVRVWRIA